MNKEYRGVLASLAVEGLEPSNEAKKWTMKYLNGTLTSKIVIDRILRKYGVVK